MNYKSMVLIALFLPVFCYSQNNEDGVAVLEEHVAALEANLEKIVTKHVLEVISLVEEDTKKAVKIVNASTATVIKATDGVIGAMSVTCFVIIYNFYSK